MQTGVDSTSNTILEPCSDPASIVEAVIIEGKAVTS